MKILTVVGARPQFIKAATVSRALINRCQEIILHTGQHYDSNMSQIFFDELSIPHPDINLNIGSASHAVQTGQMMAGIENVLLQETPDWLLVYGDTNSTIAGALAAAKLHIPVAHVEAGLRSFNRLMPEEVNRVLTDHISGALFCPTAISVTNLNNEGVKDGVYLVGDVMGDGLDYYLPVAQQRSAILETMGLEPCAYALATLHRAENTDQSRRLQSILEAFGRLNIPIVLPLHPRTKNIVEKLGLSFPKNIRLIDPVGYLDMLRLEASANCILTDSGGMQKEAYWLGVRCITLRDETEWVETVDCGWNRLAGANADLIVSYFNDWFPSGEREPLFGDGHSAEKISDILIRLS